MNPTRNPPTKPEIMCSGANTETDPIDLNFIKRGGFSDEELAMLIEAELRAVQRSVEGSIALNGTFRRSSHFPFPRDLSFPSEKPLFVRWARGKKNIVEIGVFEGASAIIFRRAMAPDGTLHLIDPYVVVPDSGLTARPWMARLNLMRSLNGNVRWHRDYSDNVAMAWNKPIDLLFIDGDHSYKATKSDWEKWHGHVINGGIVMFHDARMGKENAGEWDGWPGPTRVVDELFRGPNKLSDWNIIDEISSLVIVKRIHAASRINLKNYDAVIFDNDGVVINSEPLNFRAASDVFRTFGIQLQPDDVCDGIGAGSKYMSMPAEKHGLTGVSTEQLMSAREARFKELAPGNLKAFPNLPLLLAVLRNAGVKTSVASSAPTDIVLANLSMAGVDKNEFNNIVDSGGITDKKPAPDIFLRAAKELGVHPSRCLVVEDSPAGIEAARRAGMKVVAVTTTLSREKLSNADYVVSSLGELLTLLNEKKVQ